MGKHECYTLTFDATTKRLSKIVHISGGEVVVDAKLHITASYTLQDNYDDFQAHLSLPPLQNVKLTQFFCAKSRTGPYRVSSFHGKPKLMEEKAQELYHEWEQKQKDLHCGRDVPAAIAEEVTQYRKEEQKKSMTKAREVAIPAMSKNKAHRSIQLG